MTNRFQDFERFVRSRVSWTQPENDEYEGASFCLVSNHERGGVVKVQQTRFDSKNENKPGELLPTIKLKKMAKKDGDDEDLEGALKVEKVVSQPYVSLPLDSEIFDWMYQEYLDTIALKYTINPTTASERQQNKDTVNFLMNMIGAPIFSGDVDPDPEE